MGRIIRTVVSLGVVLVAYWAYAVLAVPLIEPVAARYDSGSPSDADLRDGRQIGDNRLRELDGLFPPGSWELSSPQILESGRVKLLVPNYVNRPDGSVWFSRCTMILTPNAPQASPAERKRRTVILQSSDGAVLRFDKRLTLRQADLGGLRLKSGILEGRVTIRSQGKSPGPEDDLLIVTRNVELTEDQISTLHPVEFRLGPNYGSGSDMRISLLKKEKDADGHGLNVSGIAWFELRRLKQLCLWLPQRPDMPGGKPKPADGGRGPRDPGVPVEIKCQGPFRYNHVRQEASFEDRVDVLQINPEGPADKITCERLSIFFARSRESVGDLLTVDPKDRGQRGPGEFDLEPCRIVARGNPVVVDAPSQDVHAQGERLEYDLQRKRIVLDYLDAGTRQAEVVLRKGTNEIHARSLWYESTGPGRLGRIAAQGPGWILAHTEDRPPRQLHATWGKQLLVQPHEGQQVVSLSGNSRLTFGQLAGDRIDQLGELSADEIHFWLFELPPDDSTPAGQPRLRPDRMSALRNVRLNSPQLTGTVEELGIWFEQEEPFDEQPAAAQVATGRITGVLPVYPSSKSTGAADERPTPRAATRLRQFDVTGRVLTSRVIIRGDEPELSELTVEGNVVFRETQTAEPDEPPLIITGDQVQVFNADTADTEVVVVGLNPPARLEGRGLKLSGTNIKLDRGSNWLWINGVGQMELPVDRDLKNRPLAQPGVLKIDWQEKMEFNGRTVSFFDSVTATGPNQRLTTQRLDVSLSETFDFADPNMDREPDVARIECHGDVVMDNWSYTGPAQTSWERMQASDLSVDKISGEITGRGRGRITRVQMGTSKLSVSPFDRGSDGSRPDGDRPDEAQGDPNQLTYLNVEFEDRIGGNLHDQTVSFYGNVHCVYGPVDSWDATLDMNDPDSLGPEGVLLTSDQLTVTKMASPLDGSDSMELAAEGNVRVEGDMFNAWGHRMTYDQAKDLLILEGTGRVDAELFFQKHVGDPPQHFQMGKIRYRPSTKQIQIDDARSAEFSQFSAQ